MGEVTGLGASWVIPASHIKNSLDIADLASERVKQAEMLARAAADGKIRDRHGNATAKLSSDAVDGYTCCVIHGQMVRIVDSQGRPSLSGVCESCFKEDWNPEILRRRELESNELPASAKQVRAGHETQVNRSDVSAVDTGAGQGVRRDSWSQGGVRVERADVEAHEGNRQPGGQPGTVTESTIDFWLNRH